MSISTCFNFDLRMDQHRHLGGSCYYSVGEETPSIWDLDSSSLIKPVCSRPEFRQTPLDGMKREISQESGYLTAIDENNSSSRWASDWPTTEEEDQHSQHQNWPSDVQPPPDDLTCWYQQQPDLLTCGSHLHSEQQDQNWSIPWGTSWTQPTTESAQMATPPTTSGMAAAGRSESSSSDETETVSLPSGTCLKIIYLKNGK